ncbi:MAG TPA: hypothetical protein VGE39_16900 [Prosthecobacter sp.]
MSAEPWLSVPIFPLAFAALWIVISFVISRAGWHAFATRYPAPSRPAGRAYGSPNSWFGRHVPASYNNVVRVIFTDAGIYFYTLFLFRAFHRPFLLPWDSVQKIEKKEIFFKLFRSYHLEIEDPAGKIRVRLPLKVEADLFRHLPKPDTDDSTGSTPTLG